MSWNYFDVLLILLVILIAANGWRRGFILGLLDLVQGIGSLLIGLRFYKPVARFLGMIFDWSEVWRLPIAFLLTTIFSGVLIQLLGYQLLKRLPTGTHKRPFNRLLGIIPGIINGAITTAIIAALLLALPLSDGLNRAARESVLANRLAEKTEQLETALSPIFDEAVARTITFLTIRPEPESNERVDLPFKITNSRPRPDLEAQMLELINRERAAAGLKSLEADPALTEVGRLHSADMFARGYFAHVTPEGLNPFDRMHQAGLSFLVAGENLALAPTLTLAHSGLMNSPGHRANILRPQFGRLGIGIMDGGIHGLMVSQEFHN